MSRERCHRCDRLVDVRVSPNLRIPVTADHRCPHDVSCEWATSTFEGDEFQSWPKCKACTSVLQSENP